MQTRRYPRSLGEAFPNTTEYACAVERPYKRPSWPLWALVAFSVALALAAVR